MKLIYNTILIATICISFFACKKGPYINDIKPINEVGITFANNKFTINQLDTLRIQPQVTETMSNKALKYEWVLYLKESKTGVVNKVIKLSNQKDLDKVMSQEPAAYYLQYTVTDTITGISSAKRMELTINGSFYEGWLVSNMKAGKSQLSFIRVDDKLYINPFEGVNNTPFNGSLLSAYAGVSQNLSEITIFTTSETYLVNANDFTIKKTSSNLFEETFTNKNPFYTNTGLDMDQYIINNGSLYANIAPWVESNIPGKYSIKIESDNNYSLFPGMIDLKRGGVYNIFYDNLNKRFLRVTPQSRRLNRFSATLGDSFKPDDVGLEMIAVDNGPNISSSSDVDEHFAVMKDNAGGYYILSILANTDVTGIKQLMSATEISQATSFAMSSKLKHLYYAVNNKIYLYDVIANNSHLVYQFAAGTNIRQLKMLKSKGIRTATNPLYNKRIVAATYNGTEGEVYYFDLMPIGDIENNAPVKKFGGFGDIVHLNYRNPNEE